jgi:uncharacterized protein YbjT (DUF2867 family)
MKTAILGAPGCVGKALIQELLADSGNIITASFRTEKEIPEGLTHERLVWKKVNLMDPASADAFMGGSESLIYLIHSLGAKNFEQLDVQLAHAAGEAAQRSNIMKIIYLGGIVPPGRDASPHLTSRMETGKVLASHGIPVGEVRASILLDACSMSFRIVYQLAKRLPVMITPKWLNSVCAPIALTDAASCITALLKKEIRGHEIFEIGSDVVRYRDLLSLCGKAIHGFENIIIAVPFFPVSISARWIQLITGVPNSVGVALAEGLRTNTAPALNRFREVTGRDPVPLERILKKLAIEMGSFHGKG